MTGLRRIVDPRAWSLSAKLAVALLFAALVPMALSVYFGLRESIKQVEATEYRNLELLASSTANQLDQLVRDNQYAVMQIAGNSDIIRLLTDPGDTQAGTSANATALNTLNANPAYEYVYVMNKDGLVVLSQQLPELASQTVFGKDFHDRAYFVQAMKGTPYIDVLVGRTSKRLGFYFSAPVKDAQNNIIGVAIIKLQGEAITNVVNQFKVGTGGYAFLTDQYGVIISHPQKDLYYKSLVPLDKNAEEIVALRFVLGDCVKGKPDTCHVDVLNTPELGPAVVGTKSPNHISFEWPSTEARQIGGLAPVTTLGWIVGVDKPADEFEQPLVQVALQGVLIVAVVGVIVGIIGLMMARSIASPMRKLADAAFEVQHDQPFSPDDIADVRAQPNEVGNLARVFSDMVVSLRARVAELRTIYEVGTTLSSNIEVVPTLTYLVNALKPIIPYDAAEVSLYDEQNNVMVRRVAVRKDSPLIRTSEATYSLDGYLGHMVAEHTGLLVTDTATFDQAAPNTDRTWDDFQPKSYLGALLKNQNKIIGAVELASRDPNRFSQDNQRILESIGLQAAVIIQNAREVELREQNLKAQIEQLRIEIDEVKKAKQVAEITESSFFEELTRKAKEFKKSSIFPKKAEEQN
jgi:GAF domain-containing protein